MSQVGPDEQQIALFKRLGEISDIHGSRAFFYKNQFIFRMYFAAEQQNKDYSNQLRKRKNLCSVLLFHR